MLHQNMQSLRVIFIQSGQCWREKEFGTVVVVIGVEEDEVLFHDPSILEAPKDFTMGIGTFLSRFEFNGLYFRSDLGEPTSAISFTPAQVRQMFFEHLDLCLECRASLALTGHRCAGKAMDSLGAKVLNKPCQCPHCHFKAIYGHEELDGPVRIRRALASIQTKD